MTPRSSVSAWRSRPIEEHPVRFYLLMLHEPSRHLQMGRTWAHWHRREDECQVTARFRGYLVKHDVTSLVIER